MIQQLPHQYIGKKIRVHTAATASARCVSVLKLCSCSVRVKKLYAVAYDPDSYVAYSANDMTVLAEHITAGGVSDMAYQQQSDSVIWMVRADGALITMGIDREQNVVAWSRQITNGAFESVASIPSNTDDVVYALARRVVNGQTVRYVEVFDKSLNTDAAVTGWSEEGAAVWSGFSHLEGQIVDVVADGSVMPQQTVTGGKITLTRKAYLIEAGMHYKTTIETLTPEVSTTEGTTQNARKRTSEVTLRFLNTTGAECNGQIIPFRTFGPKNPQPASTVIHWRPLHRKTGLGTREDTLTIQQRQPLPFHLLAIIFYVYQQRGANDDPQRNRRGHPGTYRAGNSDVSRVPLFGKLTV